MQAKKTSMMLLSGLGLLAAGFVFAGSLNPTNAPGPTMYTVEDVYRVLAGTTAETKIGLNNTNTPAPTMHTIEDLYQLAVSVASGSGSAAVMKTGATNSYATGDDGWYEKGKAWPSTVFTVGSGSESNCVTDNRTGLMWVRNPSSTPRVWTQAVDYCEALNDPVDAGRALGNYTDWRMPNIREILSLFDFGAPNGIITMPANHPFVGPVPAGVYIWSSDSMPWAPSQYCWVPNTGEAITTFYDGKNATNCYVWAVRGGN